MQPERARVAPHGQHFLRQLKISLKYSVSKLGHYSKSYQSPIDRFHHRSFAVFHRQLLHLCETPETFLEVPNVNLVF